MSCVLYRQVGTVIYDWFVTVIGIKYHTRFELVEAATN